MEEQSCNEKLHLKEGNGSTPSIKMDNVSCKWEETKVTLSGISLDIEGDQLVMVVGPVGSGKVIFCFWFDEFFFKNYMHIYRHPFFNVFWQNCQLTRVIAVSMAQSPMPHKKHGYFLEVFDRMFFWARNLLEKSTTVLWLFVLWKLI
jgi:hypothetical protein